MGGAPQPIAARTPSPATAAAADFRAWPPAESGRDRLPTGAANFVVGGGANPDKPPPRGASMEFARDGGRTSDIWTDRCDFGWTMGAIARCDAAVIFWLGWKNR